MRPVPGVTGWGFMQMHHMDPIFEEYYRLMSEEEEKEPVEDTDEDSEEDDEEDDADSEEDDEEDDADSEKTEDTIA